MGLAAKEAIRNNAECTTEYIDERIMAMRLEISGLGGAITSVAVYAPTEVYQDGTE